MTEQVFPAQLVTYLRAVDRITALTGAGVSQESGLRTFRDAQVGLWAQYRPEELASPQAFAENPKLVWDWYAMRREAVKQTRPNPGHYALAEMAQQVRHFSLITQNVDGLHWQAGSPQVIELHGNIQQVRCSACGRFAETWTDDGDPVPRCESCSEMLRPHVIWFGESLPAEALQAAVEATRACDVFFSIGTSGLVQPAASLAMAAKSLGALVIEINLEPTPLTPQCDFAFHGKSGDLLPALVRAIWGE